MKVKDEIKKRPQDKWDKKAGLMAKTYKLKKEVVEAFAAACEKTGSSQAGKLTELMKAFIEETNKEQ